MYHGLVVTNPENCTGCNKCVLKCPTHANEAIIKDKQNRIMVNELRCINCGECIDICEHNARSFSDDTVRFFKDLYNQVPISLVVAPAIKHNILNYKKLFSYLKTAGVNLIYDISFGANITTWAYLKHLKEHQIKTMISQPCPVIVSYIEKFKPSLIEKLAPIQSPAICTATYVNQYSHNTDKIACLSPCIAKSVEFSDENTNNQISYNITFDQLMEYLKNNQINLDAFQDSDYDSDEVCMGFTYSRPGGLKENVEFYLGEDTWVRQIEDPTHVKKYLNEYEQRCKFNKRVPILIDILNCKNGCNIGTASTKELSIDDIDYRTNSMKKQVDFERSMELFHNFDENLNFNDFTRNYTDRSNLIPKDQIQDIEKVFAELGKVTDADKNINCFSCGYGSCRDFALAVANGHNHKENCVHYSQLILNKSLEEFDLLFDELEKKLINVEGHVRGFNKSSKNLQDLATHTKIISLNASIESAHVGQFGAGFAVIAEEMKNLADKSAVVIKDSSKGAEVIAEELILLKSSFNKIKQEMHETMNIF